MHVFLFGNEIPVSASIWPANSFWFAKTHCAHKHSHTHTHTSTPTRQRFLRSHQPSSRNFFFLTQKQQQPQFRLRVYSFFKVSTNPTKHIYIFFHLSCWHFWVYSVAAVVEGAVAGSVVGKDPLLDEHPSVWSLMFMIIESLHVPPR